MAIRALAHPVRLSLISLLGREGPTTSAEAARELGIARHSPPASLRRLAKYGFVEPAEQHNGRDRPWQVTALSTSWRGARGDPQGAEAADVLEQLLAERAMTRLLDWQRRRDQEDPRWQDETGVSTTHLMYLTHTELTELNDAIEALVTPLVRRRQAGQAGPRTRCRSTSRRSFPCCRPPPRETEMRRAWQLVARNHGYRLLLTAGLVSLAGDWVLSVGLTYQVYRLTGSTLASGTMLLAWWLPQIPLGSVAGVLADRWDRRLTMVTADLLLAAGLLPLLLAHGAGQVWIVYLVAFWEGAVEQFFIPAQAASVPHLVAADELTAAKAWPRAGAERRSAGRFRHRRSGGSLRQPRRSPCPTPRPS